MASLPHLEEQNRNTQVRCLPPKPTTVDLIGGIYCHICNLTFGNKKEFDSHYKNHKTEVEETVYTCVVCHKQIQSYKSFQGHCYLNHVCKDKFKCEHCSKMFPRLCALTQHVISVHTFNCITCNRKFPSKKELVVHEIIHKIEKSKPPYPCLICKKNIDNSDICEMHIDEHSTTSYPCLICEETLTTKVDAVKHLSKHFGDELSECNLANISEPHDDHSSIDSIGILCCFCNDVFKTRTEFDLHFMVEHGDRELVYTCTICNKKYDKYELYGNHCHFHISKNKYKCYDCGKMFSRLSLLFTHTEAYHSGKEVDKPFGCDICGHAFKSNNRLICHRRRVHFTAAFECPQCDKMFHSNRDMLFHLREHKNIHQNWCRHCNLYITTLSSCEKHLDIHRIKRYSCPICSREYKEKHLILKHLSLHFESVLHICKVCSKTYSSKRRLEQHKKTHKTIRSYMCTFCSKGFNKPIDLKQHINIHTGSKPYKCLNCPKKFANQPNLMKHLKCIHNIDYKLRDQTLMECDQFNSTEVATVMEVEAANAAIHPTVGKYDESVLHNIDPDTIKKQLQIFCENNNAQDCALTFDIDDMLPKNTATLVIDTLQPTKPSVQQSACVPPEYGPDFVNCGVETATVQHGDFIDLDDHIMPHIDPLLTIKGEVFQAGHIPYESCYAPTAWEPPIVTTFYPNYTSYNDIADYARL